jgi:hypothetical protein
MSIFGKMKQNRESWKTWWRETRKSKGLKDEIKSQKAAGAIMRQSGGGYGANAAQSRIVWGAQSRSKNRYEHR